VFRECKDVLQLTMQTGRACFLLKITISVSPIIDPTGVWISRHANLFDLRSLFGGVADILELGWATMTFWLSLSPSEIIE